METRRVLRHEKKYMLNAQQAAMNEMKISAVLYEDPNNGADGYAVRSLYFDTMADRDIHEKLDGVETRRKMRLRIYSPDAEFVFLEEKQKQGVNQLKRSMKITRSDAYQLVGGDYSPLLKYEGDFAAECYGILTIHTYRPKVIVEYQRKAYIRPENDIRITFDSKIRSTQFCQSFFDRDPGFVPVLSPAYTVLEVKYNHFLLSYIKDLLEQCNKSELAVSKYVLARQQKMRF